MRPAQVYVPMHWGPQFMHGAGSNALTIPTVDPISQQPELKHVAVQVEKLDYRWQLFALRSGDALKYLDAVRPLLTKFPYASCGLYGRSRPLLVFRAAAPAAASDMAIAELDVALALDDATRTMDYRDSRRGVSKRVLIEDDVVIGARLTGETAARDWLKELIAQGVRVQQLRAWVLAPLDAPPLGEPQRGRVVCNCLDVSERDIRSRAQAGNTLGQLQSELGCGTSCGSCVPEIKRLLAERTPETTA
jgi:assimilatory nitrate reductase catalytic subunit